jgi:hypothetical protein
MTSAKGTKETSTGSVLKVQAGTPSVLRLTNTTNVKQREQRLVSAKSESQTMWLLTVKKAYISCLLYIYTSVDQRNV